MLETHRSHWVTSQKFAKLGVCVAKARNEALSPSVELLEVLAPKQSEPIGAQTVRSNARKVLRESEVGRPEAHGSDYE